MVQLKEKNTIFICDSPFSSHSSFDAYQYCQEVLSKQKAIINSVFFFSEAVYLANNLVQIPYDELNLAQLFADLNSEYSIKLDLCIGACQKRGILDEQLANKENQSSNMIEGYRLVGLVNFYQSIIAADYLLSFKNNQITKIKISQKRLWLIYPDSLPYQNLYFRELFELALTLASFDEKVYFVVDQKASQDLNTNKTKYFKDMKKMLSSAGLFSIDLINDQDYMDLKNDQGIIEIN